MNAFPPSLTSLTSLHNRRRVVVAVPAHNEAEQVASTVLALRCQTDLAGRPLRNLQILIVANNCTDDTAAQARAAAGPGSADGVSTDKVSADRISTVQVLEAGLSGDQANVVGARRLALNLAAAQAGEDGVIVSTDADTVPEATWLWHLCAPFAQGADAVAGRILLSQRSRAELPEAARRTQRLDTVYRLGAEALSERLNPQPHDPWPRHHQHFGANLALSVRAYRAIGGVPRVQALEDLAMVRALRQHDLRLRHTPDARVHTSARLCGRVELGLSTQLREWCGGPDGWTVPGGPEIVALARAEAVFRQAWFGHPVPRCALADAWLAPPDQLEQALSAATLGLGLEAAHAARQSGEWSARFPAVPVRQAWEELRILLGTQGGVPCLQMGGAADD